jgi:hypothetical protein
MAARKRHSQAKTQVGWYCDHEHEPYGEGSHMSAHGKYKRGKYIETYPEPNTHKAMSMLDYKDPKKKPPCPLAIPMYVLTRQLPGGRS